MSCQACLRCSGWASDDACSGHSVSFGVSIEPCTLTCRCVLYQRVAGADPRYGLEALIPPLLLLNLSKPSRAGSSPTAVASENIEGSWQSDDRQQYPAIRRTGHYTEIDALLNRRRYDVLARVFALLGLGGPS